jgi:lysophospholipase L1-like esterase
MSRCTTTDRRWLRGPRRARWAALAGSAFAAVLALAGLAAVTPPALAAAPVRIMPLGDSITGGPGCWRALLWQRLVATGYQDIDFVGTLPGGGCITGAWDGDNEGHGGYQAINIATQDQLPGWLSTTRPDVVLMHLGTNDIWNHRPIPDILAAFTKLVGQMRAGNPDMRIIAAQIVPMNPPGCANCTGDVVTLNAAIPGWAAALSTARSPITVVDQWTGFDTVADTIGDGVHPDDSGFARMADRWYPALTRVLDGLSGSPTPSPTRTTAATTTTATPPTTTPPPAAACTAAFTVTNAWAGGFQGSVTVTNSGTRPITGWSVTWVEPSGQAVSQVWNGTVSRSGSTVTVTNAGWNGALAPGATATAGFLSTATGAPATPATSCRAS